MYRKTGCAIQMQRKRARCAAMRAAKERRRLESSASSPGWRMVRAVWLAIYAAPDGRHIEMHAVSDRGDWRRCGSERVVRAALAQIVWKMKGRSA